MEWNWLKRVPFLDTSEDPAEPRASKRPSMPGTSIQRIARRGCWRGWQGHWSGTTRAQRRRSGRASRRRLTVQRLGLTGTLARTLRTTNIIENLMGSVERYTRRVKRCGGGR